MDELFRDAWERQEFDPERRKKVGGYVLGRMLGEGSFARVRLGVHLITGQQVAVKVIDKKVIRRRDYVRRNMRREAAVLQRLDHPNIVRLLEIMETENSFYMVLDLVEGGDMMDYLNHRNGVDEGEARQFMRQIVSALEHAHRSGVVHRDLKVENLLIDKDRTIKIIDFGLSNFCSGDSLLSTQCGSPAYVAPEIFSGRPYGPGADVWSVGVNMFAMLTGSLPFDVGSRTNLTKLHSLIMKGCHIPSYLSDGCRDLLSRMLQVNDAQRISLSEALTHPWLGEGYVPLEPWPLPAVLPVGKLEPGVLHYMGQGLGLDAEQTGSDMVNGRPTALSATYRLLVLRLERSQGFPGTPSQTVAMDCGILGVSQLDGKADIQVLESSRLGQDDLPPQLQGVETNQEADQKNVQPKSSPLELPDIGKENNNSREITYKQCLKELKCVEQQENNILQKQTETRIELDPIDKVAEVNTTSQQTNTNQKSAKKLLKFCMKDDDHHPRKRLSLSRESTQLRTLSNRFLQNYGVNELHVKDIKPTQPAHSSHDPSHRLRVLEMMQRYGTNPSSPPDPPNSAHVKKLNESAQKPHQSNSTTEPSETSSRTPTKGLSLNHRCSPIRRPVVHLKDKAVPDTGMDRFYDGYRFKVRTSDGERAHTWDLGALSDRSLTSANTMLKREGTGLRSGVQGQRNMGGDPIIFKDLGISYTIPEHNSVPRSRQKHSSETSSSESRSSAFSRNSSSRRRPVHVNSRDFQYKNWRSSRASTFTFGKPRVITDSTT